MTQQPMQRGRRILLTTVSSDSHTWNLVFLQLFLEENGHEVRNLGPCVPDPLLLESVRDYRPDAIVVSSVNGHGFLDGKRLIAALRRDPAARSVPTMIGGKLGTRGEDNTSCSDALVQAGFDAVFTESAPEALASYLDRLSGRTRAALLERSSLS